MTPTTHWLIRRLNSSRRTPLLQEKVSAEKWHQHDRLPEEESGIHRKAGGILVQQTVADCRRNIEINSAAVLTYGKKERKNTDWFDANISAIEPVIDATRNVYMRYKLDPSQQNLQALKASRSKAQQTARCCSYDYLFQLSKNIQEASNTGNIRKMYEGIKQATGKSTKKPASIESKTGEVITDRAKQMERWVEHYLDVYMRNAKIVTLYKSKGNRSDCNNYRDISLLSIVGKVFARVVWIRLQVRSDRVYPESQSGFRAERSTVDMNFSVRQLQEKCCEQYSLPLYIVFIDLTNEFNLVSRSGLFQLLKKIGCPP